MYCVKEIFSKIFVFSKVYISLNESLRINIIGIRRRLS